jgi:hypothetical protein
VRERRGGVEMGVRKEVGKYADKAKRKKNVHTSTERKKE